MLLHLLRKPEPSALLDGSLRVVSRIPWIIASLPVGDKRGAVGNIEEAGNANTTLAIRVR